MILTCYLRHLLMETQVDIMLPLQHRLVPNYVEEQVWHQLLVGVLLDHGVEDKVRCTVQAL